MIADARYSWLDRVVHRVAFSNPAVQLTAADVERAMYGRRFTAIDPVAPVFITSLPRAGTTLMLEALATVPGVATYTYRDMPFVLAPLLWEALSKGFRRTADPSERAHGDGMLVGYDSPEAFEEVLWRACWPEKFTARGIALWDDRETPGEFRRALTSQMQRIIAARANGGGRPGRYVSKNNANVARIGFLKRLFADSVVLVPFRDPIEQSASLHRQHVRFLQRHRDDPFARRYMDDIGHLEFGALHRPLLFDGMTSVRARYGAETLEYWLAYWICAFTHVLRYRDDIVLVSYERLCREGADGLRTVADRLHLPEARTHEFAGTALRANPPATRGKAVADAELTERALALHDRLVGLSVV